ncbi:MAG: NAD-dependent epimerase/dehydratase family protein [Syntrophales bacterium]
MSSQFHSLTQESSLSHFYSNKRILITGGRGYLGACLSEALSITGSLIYILDNSPSRWMPTYSDNIRLLNADICEISSYEHILTEVDIIFHLAALEYNRTAYDPVQDYSINAKPVLDILESCTKKDVRPTIIYSSSANIFGIQQSLPINESSKDNPPSLWSAHKLLAENYISVYSTKYNFRSIILRLPNVFGPSARFSRFNRSSINSMIVDAVSKGIINLYGNYDCIRDQIFTTDATSSFLHSGVIAKDVSGRTTCVIGSGVEYTYQSLSDIISKVVKQQTGKGVLIRFYKDKYNEPIDQRNFLADFSYFSSLTGWSPVMGLVPGIIETVRYFLGRGK